MLDRTRIVQVFLLIALGVTSELCVHKPVGIPATSARVWTNLFWRSPLTSPWAGSFEPSAPAKRAAAFLG